MPQAASLRDRSTCSQVSLVTFAARRPVASVKLSMLCRCAAARIQGLPTEIVNSVAPDAYLELDGLRFTGRTA